MEGEGGSKEGIVEEGGGGNVEPLGHYNFSHILIQTEEVD